MLKVDALVLAAGLSSRMHKNKLLMQLSGKAVVQRTIENILASDVSCIKVILGNNRDEIRSRLADYKVGFVDNNDYALGMSTSIRAGINHYMCEKIWPDAIMIFLGDMPLIKTDTINNIIRAYEKGNDLVVPVWQGRTGHPVLFDKKYFHMLTHLRGDSGARAILSQVGVFNLEVVDPAIHMDIDCWDDYILLKKLFREGNEH